MLEPMRQDGTATGAHSDRGLLEKASQGTGRVSLKRIPSQSGNTPWRGRSRAGGAMASFDYRSNHLLAAMPPETLRRWCPQLQPVDMPIGMVVYEPGQAIQHVYFPLNALVSLLHVLEDGDMAEIAITGRDGVVGISCFMGGGAGSSRGVVQSAGRALRLCTSALLEEFDRSGEARHLLLRYTQALIAQMTQTAVCNRHHTIEQQLCRWLLLSLDRLDGPDLVMTQELIANMLGVRREGVTAAAARLQRAGRIRYSRGHITVLDREAVERCSCECYAAVKREYERLLPACATA
jgi:CRP-like cAMP-binding protein